MFHHNNMSEGESFISQLQENRGVTDFGPLIPLDYCSIPGACHSCMNACSCICPGGGDVAPNMAWIHV